MDMGTLPLGELLALDLTTLEPAQLSEFSTRIYRKRKQAEAAVETLKRAESAANEHARTTFLVGVEKSELTHGTYKHTDTEYMVLPEEGWPRIFEDMIERVNKGEAIDEVFDILSYQRLRTKHFEKLNDDELPSGIKRDRKLGVKFTQKRNVEL